MSTIIQTLGQWATSFTGILTILIVIIAASRLIFTSIREKYGQDSHVYRNTKFLSGAFYLIVTINALSILFHGWFGTLQGWFSSFFTFISQSAWTELAVFSVFYAFFIGIAHKRLSYLWGLAASMSLFIFGSYLSATFGVYGSGGWTTVGAVGAVASCLINLCCIGDKRAKITEEQPEIEDNSPYRTSLDATRSHYANDQQGTFGEPLLSPNFFAKHSILAACLWLCSVILAYIAGEYSLIPKAIEYIQSQFTKHATSSTSTTPESFALQPTKSDL